jgi:hypothetical protein
MCKEHSELQLVTSNQQILQPQQVELNKQRSKLQITYYENDL